MTLIPAGIPAEVVATRRREVEQAADLVVPPIVYGDAFQPLPADGRAAATLTGIPGGTRHGPRTRARDHRRRGRRACPAR